MDCSSPMSMKIWSKMPMSEVLSIGTGRPHCIIYCSRPTLFRHTDLPPALGPEMIRIRFSGSNRMSNGTTSLWCFL